MDALVKPTDGSPAMKVMAAARQIVAEGRVDVSANTRTMMLASLSSPLPQRMRRMSAKSALVPSLRHSLRTVVFFVSQ